MRKITTYSFYEWDLMNEKEREEKSHIIELLLLDYIHLNDFFLDLGNEISDKSSYENKLLEVNGQLNSIEVTFLLGGVFNLDHQSLLEDIAYEILASTHGSKLLASERAKIIITAWLKALLALKGGFLKLD
ncbi:hypothetical protein N9Y86_00930 [Flavobacteriaceae bacterium]|nr:hypothetical protein [Flavobacteriaceae bacterium]MDA8923503.1 hypothetical protein [Flavobacteriaceae bacterium]MDA9984424.1 hypothetical protein [Flavobacteriaceae bacterium]MDB2672450.1 hypothetical protein [Flavobacteriaceae bacterium]MDB4186935.1 hypothetical protein [Flavobacteriaceae bacterium]